MGVSDRRPLGCVLADSGGGGGGVPEPGRAKERSPDLKVLSGFPISVTCWDQMPICKGEHLPQGPPMRLTDALLLPLGQVGRGRGSGRHLPCPRRPLCEDAGTRLLQQLPGSPSVSAGPGLRCGRSTPHLGSGFPVSVVGEPCTLKPQFFSSLCKMSGNPEAQGAREQTASSRRDGVRGAAAGEGGDLSWTRQALPSPASLPAGASWKGSALLPAPSVPITLVQQEAFLNAGQKTGPCREG